MTSRLNPYLSFRDNARGAMEFYRDVLGEGGEVQTPLERQMGGDELGMLRDRFGVGWMVNVAGAPG